MPLSICFVIKILKGDYPSDLIPTERAPRDLQDRIVCGDKIEIKSAHMTPPLVSTPASGVFEIFGHFTSQILLLQRL